MGKKTAVETLTGNATRCQGCQIYFF